MTIQSVQNVLMGSSPVAIIVCDETLRFTSMSMANEEMEAFEGHVFFDTPPANDLFSILLHPSLSNTSQIAGL